jgi:hypothetical protein
LVANARDPAGVFIVRALDGKCIDYLTAEGLDDPWGIAYRGSTGQFYVSDFDSGRIFCFDSIHKTAQCSMLNLEFEPWGVGGMTIMETSV